MKAARPSKNPASDRGVGCNLRLLPLIFLLPLFVMAEVVVPIDSVENSVNIRMSADAKSEIVGKLQQGKSLPLVQSVTDWHEVEISGGATGYISADWSRVVEEIPVAESQANDAVATEVNSNEAPTPPAIAETVVADSDSVVDTVAAEAETEPLGESDVDSVSAASESTSEASADEFVVVEALEEIQLVVQKMPPVTAEEQIVAEAGDDVVEDDSQAIAGTEGPEIASDTNDAVAQVAVATAVSQGSMGPPGPPGPPGPQGPPGQSGTAKIEGSPDFLMKFSAPTIGANSQVYDDGNNIGIGTTEPKQRLEVNGNIQIHERNSSVAGLMITQASGDTGYIMHNQASTLTIGAGSIDRITINRDGNIGMGVNRPAHPIEMASGAYVSAGGVWTNSSSRDRKENIADLTPEEAIAALAQLQPVEFNYKNDQQEKYIGFIAEDVPDLVATQDRQSLSTMDIVAVLTKVVQEQQKKIAALEAKLEQR